MYKVLIVDDEWIIRDGITRLIPWEEQGFHVAGVAENGLAAWELIVADPPEIIITDVKMPGLNGLELIAKVHAVHPEIRFVVLSGFNEFELAKEAMRYGVKHYLLKPCNENRIMEVMAELKAELNGVAAREAAIRQKQEQLLHVLPLVKEQFVREFVAYRHYTGDEYDYYCSLLGIEDATFRMILFEPTGAYTASELFGLSAMVDVFFGAELFLGTTIKDHGLVLVGSVGTEALLQQLQPLQTDFAAAYGMEVNVAYSDPFQFDQAPLVYQQLSECLKHALYLAEGSMITPGDLHGGDEKVAHRELLFDYDSLTAAVKSGAAESVQKELNRFFQQLRQFKLGLNLWKTYTTELFMVLIRQCRPEALSAYLDKLLDLQKLATAEELQQFVCHAGLEITGANHEIIRNKYHKIIERVLSYVRDNFGNEDLSLKWLASQVVYMNEGYLSKLFLKETGEKFSHYLLRLRMEQAKELIERNGAERIYEIAQTVGLGNNPQYFSQLFKKYTGCSPSEYKKGG